ncbi:MAG: amino acid ABC transporter substrate-binding protein [Alphaproteobacteria bacterium]|nr:amino acid ABC transporter substrate-binding protein [Alphaproteobacteria bacterium]
MFGHLRRVLAATIAAGAVAFSLAAPAAAQSGQPVRIGGTLALTGPLAATAMVHKIVGEIYVEQLNKRGGLLGRPVEWVLLDDQSKPDLARTLYEKLITVDKVDLLIGPYATGAILSAMAVAERNGKMLVHHTFGIPKLAKYDAQFPAWALGPTPEQSVPNLVLDALAAGPKPPKTIAVVTSKFPSVHFLALGAREAAQKRGLKEVLFLEFEFGAKDFGPIAARVREADPDFLFMGAIGLEGNQLLEALKKLDYTPRNHFYTYPAPGPMAVGAEGANALSSTVFEGTPPFTDAAPVAAFAKEFQDRATKAGLPYTQADVQAGVSYTAWQLIEAAVVATKSLDDKVLAQWLRANKVDTIIGKLRFTEIGNYGDDLSKIKQVQGGKWVVVWPKEFAAGAKLVAR